MATPKTGPKPRRPRGPNYKPPQKTPPADPKKARPNSGRPADPKKQYRPEYCQDIVDHFMQPDAPSFETFACYIGEKYGHDYGVPHSRIKEWVNEYPDFKAAKEYGEAFARKSWEQLGRQGTTGNMRRVKSETPLFDKDGQPVLDAKGRQAYHREYEPAQFGQSSYRLIMSCRFNYRQKLELTGADGGPIETKEAELTDAEKRRKAQKYLAALDAIDEDADL